MEFMTALQSGIDEQKPSLFELFSEHQLSSLLPQTLRYLLARATPYHPRYLIHVLNAFPESYAVLSLVVEHYYLTNHAATFIENFYGLKRERVLRIPSNTTNSKTRGAFLPRAQLHPGAAAHARQFLLLRLPDVWRNLAVLVGLPYLQRRLDESYEVHAAPHAQASSLFRSSSNRIDRYPADGSIRQKTFWLYKWFLRKLYPHVNASYHLFVLAFQLAYLFDRSRFHHPLLWLVRTRVRRVSAADMRAAAVAEAALQSPASDGASGASALLKALANPKILAATAWARLLSSLRVLLPTSIFALKFLEWWHASDFARQLARKASEGLELPPPTLSNAKPATSTILKNEPQPRRRSQEQGKESSSSSPSSSPAPRDRPPVSTLTHLPILTVPAPLPESSDCCPICLGPIVTATASPYGHVYCYGCIHRWVEGTHDRQTRFMEGGEEEGEWAGMLGVGDGDSRRDGAVGSVGKANNEGKSVQVGSRAARWESGKGRCAVSGMRVLGGTGSLRRVVV